MQRKVRRSGENVGEKRKSTKGGTLVGGIHGDGGLAFPDYVMRRTRHVRNSSRNKFIELLLNTDET